MNILKETGVTYYISVDKIDNTGSLDFALKILIKKETYNERNIKST